MFESYNNAVIVQSSRRESFPEERGNLSRVTTAILNARFTPQSNVDLAPMIIIM